MLFGRRIASCFFFSSRSRHTIWTGDWSSDVCSSDLAPRRVAQGIVEQVGQGLADTVRVGENRGQVRIGVRGQVDALVGVARAGGGNGGVDQLGRRDLPGVQVEVVFLGAGDGGDVVGQPP